MIKNGLSLQATLLPVLICAGLAGCGAEAMSPTIDGPVEASGQAGPILSDFAATCSNIVIGGAQPGEALAKAGWELPDDVEAAEMAAMGGMAAEKPDMGLNAQIVPLDFPHLQGVSCTVSIFDKEVVSGVDVSTLEGLSGFSGSTESYGSGENVGDIGRWSGVASDGAVVTISAMKLAEGRFLNLAMNKTKPVSPANNDTK